MAHIHAELIKAWADNPDLTFQCRVPSAGRLHNDWTDIKRGEELLWIPSIEYRIKPEPKADIYRHVMFEISEANFLEIYLQGVDPLPEQEGSKNKVKFTIDPETKIIKKVELL